MDTLSHPAATAVLQHCPLAILLLDDSGRIQCFNRAFAALLGEAATTLGTDTQAYGLITPLLGTGTLVSWIMPDGDERWLAIETASLDEAPGITARYYQDVTEKLRLKKERDALQDEVRLSSLHDERLPGLLSRHGLQVTLDPLVSRSRRYNSPLTLLSLGIETDAARDPSITKVSFLLKDQTRWADLVGCNDDRDFILILQETTQDAALQLVDKLAARIRQLGESGDAEIRACFGVTQCQRNDDADAMLERVEAALTEARQNNTGTAISV